MSEKKKCIRPGCSRVRHAKTSRGLCLVHAKAAGLTFGSFVDHETVVREMWPHIRRGYCVSTILQTSGAAASEAKSIAGGRRMRPEVFRRIKEVDLSQAALQPAWMARRRLCSIRALGIPVDDLLWSGLRRTDIAKLCSGQQVRVQRVTWEPVMRLWERYQFDMVRPRGNNVLRHYGWPTPAMWEDIDNPDERQGTLGAITLTREGERFLKEHLRPYIGESVDYREFA